MLTYPFYHINSVILQLCFFFWPCLIFNIIFSFETRCFVTYKRKQRLVLNKLCNCQACLQPCTLIAGTYCIEGSPHEQQTLSIMYLGNTSPPAGTLTHRTLEGLYLWGSPQIAGPLAGNSVALKYRHWCDVLLSSALVSELFYVVDFFLLMVPVLSCTVPI